MRKPLAALIFLLLTASATLGNASATKVHHPETSLRESLAGEKKSDLAGIHAWLAKEMVERVYGIQVSNQKVLLPWLNILNQGASIEGLYHGLVLSDDYTKLEKGIAPTAALRFAAQEIAMLKLNKLKPDDYTKAEAELMMPKIMNLSLFTLKRELGERLLSGLEKRKADSEARAIWYAVYAARWAGEKVDFGLSERNSDSEVFHKEWAQRNSFGLLQWELLNRLHRIMNYKGGMKKADAVDVPSKTGHGGDKAAPKNSSHKK